MKHLSIVFFLLFAVVVYAQPGAPGGDPVPLDGGLIALLAAGAAYGAKKYRNNQEN